MGSLLDEYHQLAVCICAFNILSQKRYCLSSKGVLSRLPWNDPDRMREWISRISRKKSDGKPWYPTKKDKACSAHFAEFDFTKGLEKPMLREDAVPSVFPEYPQTKKHLPLKRRSSPMKHRLTSNSLPSANKARSKRRSTASSCESSSGISSTVEQDHCYGHRSLEAHLKTTQNKLQASLEKAKERSQELKIVKQKLKRTEKKIEKMLDQLHKKSFDREGAG